MSLPKLEPSGNVFKCHIKSHFSKEIKIHRTMWLQVLLSPQHEANVTQKVDLVTSAGRDFDLTIQFNASMGEEYCEWFSWGTKVSFDINQVGFAPSSLFSRDQQAAVSSLFRMRRSIFAELVTAAECTEKKYDLHELGLVLGTSIHELAWEISHKQHKNLLSSLRVITKPVMTLMNTSPCLSYPWFLAEQDGCTELLLEINWYFHIHSQAPQNACL